MGAPRSTNQVEWRQVFANQQVGDRVVDAAMATAAAMNAKASAHAADLLDTAPVIGFAHHLDQLSSGGSSGER